MTLPLNIPQELKDLANFVTWREEIRGGKSTKIPVNAHTGGNAAVDRPETWATFAAAIGGVARNGNKGIGFVLTKAGPYSVVDLDGVRNPETGEIEAGAKAIITRLNSYTEISPSGRGIHIWVRGKLPPGRRRKGNFEVYDSDRYLTLTGHHLEGTPTTIEDRQAELEALHREIFGEKQEKPQTPPKAPGSGLELSDQELIDRAHRARNGAKFAKLWRGDWQGDYPSQSEATAALLNALVFYCGPDVGRIDRLFRQSGLMREKWDRPQTGSTWGNLEIHKAIARATEFYTPRQTPATSPKAAQETPPKPTLKPISAKDLGAKTFSPPRWAVPNLLPEGLIILAGKPKAGKSWLALNVAVSVASGGMALGKIQVEAGEALYLALEDSERRLKERLEKIVCTGELPESLHLLTARDFPPLQKGGLVALDNWLEEHPQARLVVIDTLARVKPARGKNADAYDHDTAIISTLQTIAIKYALALICVHHTKKLATDDFVESVSGTFGLTGAADCIAVLIRKDRTAADAVLKITGRDVADIEKALKFYPDLGAWEILGEAQEFTRTKERDDILLILREVGPKTPAQLSKIIGKSSGAVRITLMRMKDKGEIILNQDGSYSL